MTAAAAPTLFLPAERDSGEIVESQAAAVGRAPLLRTLLDAVPDVVLILNDKRQIIFGNRQVARALRCENVSDSFGQRPGEVLGCVRSSELAGGCGTSEACRYCGAALAILSSQKGKADQRECRILRREGGEALTMRVTTTPMELESRQYTLFHLSDVSSQKRQQVLERVLFDGILGEARQVRDEAEQTDDGDLDDLKQFRGDASRFSETLIEEVNEHRILSAAERDQLRLRPGQVHVLALLRELVAWFEQRPEASGVHLRIYHTREAEIRTDRTILVQVLSYLLRNALEASKEGDRVTLNAVVQGDDMVFSIHNRGLIPRRDQAQVFQRGFTTKGLGRGLGTYAARFLCERYLKGSASFTSSESGTIFRVAIPQSAGAAT